MSGAPHADSGVISTPACVFGFAVNFMNGLSFTIIPVADAAAKPVARAFHHAALLDPAADGKMQILVAGGLSAVAFRQRGLQARDRYSTSRLKAEALRGEYFLFLGRVGAYAHEGERIRHLIRRVAHIVAEQERKQP